MHTLTYFCGLWSKCQFDFQSLCSLIWTASFVFARSLPESWVTFQTRAQFSTLLLCCLLCCFFCFAVSFLCSGHSEVCWGVQAHTEFDNPFLQLYPLWIHPPTLLLWGGTFPCYCRIVNKDWVLPIASAAAEQKFHRVVPQVLRLLGRLPFLQLL